MPILGNIKIGAEGDRLTVQATDIEISFLGKSEAKIISPGNITVDAKMFYEIIRQLPTEEDIHITASNRLRLDIESGQAKFKIHGASAEEFPVLNGIVINNPVTVDAGKILEMFNKTSYAMSTDETRHNMCGVCVDVIEGPFGLKTPALRFVATDGHRLSLIDRPADGLLISESVIVPKKSIQEIKKILEDNEGSANISIDGGYLTIQSENVTLGVRLVDKPFPDYRQVIPRNCKTTVKVPRNELLSAVKRVALMTTDKAQAIRFKITEGTLILSSSSPEFGEANDTLMIKQEGEDVTIGFNARYIVEALTAMNDNEDVVAKFNGSTDPGLFIDGSDENYNCIVMPMRFE